MDGLRDEERAGRSPPPGAREPVFGAPWPATALAALVLLSYAAQSLAGGGVVADAFGLRPADLVRGVWGGLLTCLFVHAGWVHAGLNAVTALAFGAPVARALGTRPVQAAAFLLFYLLCGAFAGLGWALLHAAFGGGSTGVLVGASGAISGLLGAASRLRPAGAAGVAGLEPLNSPAVRRMAVGWIAANLLLAVFGAGVVTGGAPVAWEAHLAGYGAGLFLFAPALAMVGRGRSRED